MIISLKILNSIHIFKSFLVDKRPRGFGRLVKIIDYLFFNKLPENEVIIKTLYGFPLYVNPSVDKGIEKKLYLTGTYEKGLLKILGQILKKGDIVVDAGANIGLISIFAAQRVGTSGLVLAFEPHPETVSILKRNILMNKLNQVRVFSVGLGSRNYKSKIYSNLHINRGASSMVSFQNDSVAYDIDVMVIDEVMEANNIDRVNLLKVDVEGYEMEVLKGAEKLLSSDNGPILVVECSNTRQNFNYSTEDLFRFLTHTHGYSVFRFAISKEKVSKLIPVHNYDELPNHDNLLAFKSNDLKILMKTTKVFED